MVKRAVGAKTFVEWFYVEEGLGEGEEDKGSFKTVNLALSWIKRRWNRKEPFFMFINLIEPHGAYWPPEPFRSRFLPSDVSLEEAQSVAKLRSVEECIDYRTGSLKLSDRDWLIEKDLYDGCTAVIDDRIGRFYSHLEEESLTEDTIFIVTSDHGDVQGEHPPHIEHHLCAYDELIRVPLIITYPKMISKGLKIRWISQTHDIAPTLLDFLEVGEKIYWKTFQGVSLKPALTEGKIVRDYALTEYNKSVQQFFHIWRRHPDFDIRRILKY